MVLSINIVSILLVVGSVHCTAFVSTANQNLSNQRLVDPRNSSADTMNSAVQQVRRQLEECSTMEGAWASMFAHHVISFYPFLFCRCVAVVPQWDASRYQKQHSFVWEYGSSLIEILDPQPGERILDVGCGTGELVRAIADRGAVCLGMDADLHMVERAKQQFPDLTFFQGYAQNFNLDCVKDEDGPLLVDAIFSNAALHWVKDAEGAVASMSRVLKPGGRFVVEFGGKGNVQRIVQASLSALGKPASENPWYFPSVAQYSTLLEKHGIELTSAALFDRPTVLEDGEEGMKNWLRMFGGAFLKDLTKERVDIFLQEVDKTLRPHMFDGQRWTADYRRIRLVGKKLG
jgi:trans-aconitate methyltransferase